MKIQRGSILSINNVSKRFGGIQALRGVSLDIARRDFVGLIGPNGSGKTTLINVITGVYKPDHGSIYFLGERIEGKPPHVICRKGISRTFQIPQPLSSMSVMDNVMLASKFCGDGDEEYAREVLERVGLGGKIHVEAGRLTLIEKRLLELARALVTKPKLILLDEVAAGLRREEINVLGEILASLNREDLTIVWVEHRVSELIRWVGRLVVMSSGSVIADGPPGEVVKMPTVIETYLGKTFFEGS